nr:hypothetical protein [Quadrisphaera sp. INWT6]
MPSTSTGPSRYLAAPSEEQVAMGPLGSSSSSRPTCTGLLQSRAWKAAPSSGVTCDRSLGSVELAEGVAPSVAAAASVVVGVAAASVAAGVAAAASVAASVAAGVEPAMSAPGRRLPWALSVAAGAAVSVAAGVAASVAPSVAAGVDPSVAAGVAPSVVAGVAPSVAAGSAPSREAAGTGAPEATARTGRKRICADCETSSTAPACSPGRRGG